MLASLEAAGADLLDARGQAQAEARVGAATNALGQATAQAERAAAALKLAETEAARRESLAERGLISQQELDVARTEFFSAQQEARASEFGQRVAEFEVAALSDSFVSRIFRVKSDLKSGMSGRLGSKAMIVISRLVCSLKFGVTHRFK